MFKNAIRVLATLVMMAVVAAGMGGPANAWLARGSHTQYPAAGGTWEYGFWNAYVRSYYTVSRCHGSSVKLNGDVVRSADTASGRRSTAEKFALDYPGADDAYYYRTC